MASVMKGLKILQYSQGNTPVTKQKMKFSVDGFLDKCEKMSSFLCWENLTSNSKKLVNLSLRQLSGIDPLDGKICIL